MGIVILDITRDRTIPGLSELCERLVLKMPGHGNGWSQAISHYQMLRTGVLNKGLWPGLRVRKTRFYSFTLSSAVAEAVGYRVGLLVPPRCATVIPDRPINKRMAFTRTHPRNRPPSWMHPSKCHRQPGNEHFLTRPGRPFSGVQQPSPAERLGYR